MFVGILVAASGIAPVAAQDYPNKGIRVAVGATPGVEQGKKRLNDIGFEVIATGPDEVRGMIARDLERMGKAVALSGLKRQ